MNLNRMVLAAVLYAGLTVSAVWANVEVPVYRVKLSGLGKPPVVVNVPDGGTIIMGGLPPIRTGQGAGD
jgi:hypothetical protein